MYKRLKRDSKLSLDDLFNCVISTSGNEIALVCVIASANSLLM